MSKQDWTDTELLEEFEEFEASGEVGFSDWEIEFFDSIMKQSFDLTLPQRTKIIDIMES